MALSTRQKQFVIEYLVDLNATAAAARAGYSKPNKQGPALLVNVGIQEALQEQLKARQSRTLITADRTLSEIARLAFSDLRKAHDANGQLLNIQDFSDDMAAAVSSIKVEEKYYRGPDGEMMPIITKEIKVWDKNSALDKLCKHLGLVSDKINMQFEDVSKMTEPQMREELARLLAEMGWEKHSTE